VFAAENVIVLRVETNVLFCCITIDFAHLPCQFLGVYTALRLNWAAADEIISFVVLF